MKIINLKQREREIFVDTLNVFAKKNYIFSWTDQVSLLRTKHSIIIFNFYEFNSSSHIATLEV